MATVMEERANVSDVCTILKATIAKTVLQDSTEMQADNSAFVVSVIFWELVKTETLWCPVIA